MKTKDIILLVVFLSVGLWIGYSLRQHPEPDYTEYHKERDSILNELKTLQDKYDRLETQIQKEHEEIDTSDNNSLRDITARLLTE